MSGTKSGRVGDHQTHANYATLSDHHRKALERIKELVDEHAAEKERLLSLVTDAQHKATAAEEAANASVREILNSRIEIEQGLLKDIHAANERANAFERNRNDRVNQLLMTIEKLQRVEAEHFGFLKRTRWQRWFSHVPAAVVAVILGLAGGAVLL